MGCQSSYVVGGKCAPLFNTFLGLLWVRGNGTWTWQYYVRPFLCVLLYPIYCEQLISPVCWPLSPLHNTLLWAAPGGYLFLHVIALSCLHPTLWTNYPWPARGRDSCLPIQSFKTSYPVTGEKISYKEKNIVCIGIMAIFCWNFRTNLRINENDQLLELQLRQRTETVPEISLGPTGSGFIF